MPNGDFIGIYKNAILKNSEVHEEKVLNILVMSILNTLASVENPYGSGGVRVKIVEIL